MIFIEASGMPGSGALTLTGLDPAFHRDTDIHLHVQAGGGVSDGAPAGVTMAAAMVSTLTGCPLRGDVAAKPSGPQVLLARVTNYRRRWVPPYVRPD